MSEKSRATVKPKSDNSVFHALRPGSSQSTHSLSGTEPLIIPPVQEGLNRRINFSGRTYKDSWNQRENASSIPGRHNFSRIRIHPEGTVLPIQPKLRINKPGDIYEQEADRVAEQVMGMPVIQAKSICPDSSCEEDEELVQARPKKITPLVQRQVEEEDEEESLQTMNM